MVSLLVNSVISSSYRPTDLIPSSNYCIILDLLDSRSKDGRSFYVKDVDTFAKNILPQYFKHSNFSSFVRQLNFYGFTKAKDIKLTESSDSKYWEFRHEDFRRDDPYLLVKIVRRTSTSTSTHTHTHTQSQKSNNGPAATGPQSENPEPKESKEQSQMKEEIQSLKGTIHSMENSIKKLSDILGSVKIDDKQPSQDKHKNKMQKVHHGSTGTVSARSGEITESGLCPKALSSKDDTIDQRLNGPSKKRILLKDSQLFGTTSTGSSSSTTGTGTGTGTSARSQTPTRNTSVNVNAPKSHTTFTVSKHVASIDLPDLSLAAGDADLFLEDHQSTVSTAIKTNRRSNSSRRGSLASTCGDGPLPLNPLNSSQSDAGGMLAEVDQIISSFESDLTSSVHVPLASTCQDNSNTMTSQQEPLPALVLDEGNDVNDDTSSQISLTSVSLSDLNDHHDKESNRPARGRNLLDQNHILNLEKCLASLPIPERITFVHGVMNNIGGLDDLIKQGLTVVAKTDPDNNGATMKSESVPSSLSRARQVVESGIDTSLLSELESLLLRVGLRIQLVSQTSNGGRQPSTVASSKLARRSSSRKKNRVEIEMEA